MSDRVAGDHAGATPHTRPSPPPPELEAGDDGEREERRWSASCCGLHNRSVTVHELAVDDGSAGRGGACRRQVELVVGPRPGAAERVTTGPASASRRT